MMTGGKIAKRRRQKTQRMERIEGERKLRKERERNTN